MRSSDSVRHPDALPARQDREYRGRHYLDMNEGGRYSQARWGGSRRAKPEAAAATWKWKVDNSGSGTAVQVNITSSPSRFRGGLTDDQASRNAPYVACDGRLRADHAGAQRSGEQLLFGGGGTSTTGAVTGPTDELPQRNRERKWRVSNGSTRPDSESMRGSAADRDDFPGSCGVRAGPLALS